MPCTRCENGKWKWGERGVCQYNTRAECERANEGKEAMELEDVIEEMSGKPQGFTAMALESRPDDQEKRRVRFRASTPDIDRHGTRVRPEGIDAANYKKNPVFLWGHDGYGGWTAPEMENVIGKTVEMEMSRRAFDIAVVFADVEVNPKGDMAYRMVRAGLLSAVSIGFIPQDVVVETEDERRVPIIKRSELLEVSLVPIPSNPSALQIVRSMAAASGVDEFMKEFEREQARAAAFKGSAPPSQEADSGADQAAEELRRVISEWSHRHALVRALRS